MNKYLGIDILKMWMVIYTHKTDIYPPNFKPGPSEKQQRNAMQLSLLAVQLYILKLPNSGFS